ncbi:MAG: hypothetical protein EOO01_12715 [Chitinophagaceae bacterium]|nr:MAG: hypothetical protein EOO01_12715 [Chitinophagaceae bacterium]
MFRLPFAPSPKAKTHELADFVEWTCWRDGTYSARAANTALNQIDDNFENEGCDDDSDINEQNLDEVFIELERRNKACAGGYPFQLNKLGSFLRHIDIDDAEPRYIVYRYLLMGTRLNMSINATHAGLRGDVLMEHLGAHIMKNYLGSKRSQSMVFGTAEEGGFAAKVDDLCSALGEGGGFKNQDEGTIYPNDGKLDVVTWTPFADGKPSKLIVFTQCKTGTSWYDEVTKTRPDAFFYNWTKNRTICHDAIRAFAVSESAYPKRWGDFSKQGGIFLDRCRLVDYAEDLKEEMVNQLKTWTDAAFSSVKEILPYQRR